jgi:hypothetical protein
VRKSAEHHAKNVLDGVANTVPGIERIALRTCPDLPPTIAERIQDYRARNVADWVMYRKALASAAQARGLAVHWFDAKKVFDSASLAVPSKNFDEHFAQLRQVVGPPWNNDHKIAMAGAISAAQQIRN